MLRTLFENEDAAFIPYYVSSFAGLLAVIGIPVALSGAVLPLLFHALRERVGDLGDVAGRLYSWNTLGSLLGALIGGYALLFWLDLHHTFRIAMAAIAVAAALMTWQRASLGRAAPAMLLAIALAAIAMLPAWRPERLNAGLFQTQGGVPQILPATYLGPEPFFDAHPLTRPPEAGRSLHMDLPRRRSDLVGHRDREDRPPAGGGVPGPAQQRKARGRHGGIRQDHAPRGAAPCPLRRPDGARLRGRLRARHDGGRARVAGFRCARWWWPRSRPG